MGSPGSDPADGVMFDGSETAAAPADDGLFESLLREGPPPADTEILDGPIVEESRASAPKC